jgi:hypothetical protein
MTYKSGRTDNNKALESSSRRSKMDEIIDGENQPKRRSNIIIIYYNIVYNVDNILISS